jgi:hypothetical protein
LATSIEPDQPALSCSLTRLYTVGKLSNFHLDIPKIDYGPFKKWELDKAIKEIQQVKCYRAY